MKLRETQARSFETLANMNNLLSSSGRIVVALGLGYNSNMDSYLKEGKIKFDKQNYMRKIRNASARS